jgi:uncharacterized membrane protein YgdD (TMEM256/DUF423 family)
MCKRAGRMANATKGPSFPLFAAGILGITGVALGAIGAHALKATLTERGMVQAWETAARYHLFHAVALVGLAAWVRGQPQGEPTRAMTWVTPCWCLGVVLFSGSLYGLALGGPRWLGPVTPLGGLAFMVGWLLVTIAAFGRRS